jgi:nicotinamidase-related amidase
MTHDLTRDVAIVPTEAVLLFIDMQNYAAHPDGGEFTTMSPAERSTHIHAADSWHCEGKAGTGHTSLQQGG